VPRLLLRLLRLLAGATLLAAAGPLLAADVAQWDAASPVELEVRIAPGEHAEICGKLAGGQAVGWSFESSKSVDFNIHYHEGRAVAYPTRRFKIARAEGRLDASIDQTYCWMWSNKRDTPTTVTVKLARQN